MLRRSYQTGTSHAVHLAVRPPDEEPMEHTEHTHEFDCIICGAHLDSEQDLARHNKEQHTPRVAADVERAEPVGNEQARKEEPDDSMS
jgi:hypothetical protein